MVLIAPPATFRQGRKGDFHGSQLGKIVKADSVNVDEQERLVSDSTNKGELPGTDTDAP
jgi:hypothetical protein